MKVAITTPSGHVGSAATEFLLGCRDIEIKMLGRRPDNMRRFLNRGAQMGVGSQDDADFLVRETKDIDALLWVTPPGYGSDNLRAFQNRLGQAAATAIRTNRIPRVVNISSIGADLESGGGPISGLHDVEEILNEAAADITHLRPGFFFENLLWQIDAIRKWGRISLPLSGSTRYPMIAAGDVGCAAADRLTDPGWSGQNARELHGPADLCFNEVAQILTDALGRKMVYIACDPEEARRHLIESGMTESAADSMLQMYEAVESEKLRALQPRSAETTTPTTLTEFTQRILMPQMAVPVSY